MKKVTKLFKETDWILLIFLFLVTNQAFLVLKPIGFLFVFLARPNFKFGFFKGRIPKFYLYIVLLALVNLFVHIRDFSVPYLTAFSIASLFWIACFLAHHQLKLSIEKYGADGVYATMKTFLILNFIFCIVQLIRIMVLTGHLNPYQNLDFPYGMSTGDNIYGFFMENCYYNVMVCAFLGIYFLFKRNLFFCFMSAACILLVFANTGTLIYIGILLSLMLLSLLDTVWLSKKDYAISKWIGQITLQKKYALSILGVIVFIFLFSFLISPDNITYSTKRLEAKFTPIPVENFQTTPQVKNKNEKQYPVYDTRNKKLKTFILSSHDEVNVDTPRMRAKAVFIKEYLRNEQAKKLSLIETFLYLPSSPSAFLLGAGPARFSSQLAQRMSGLDSSRIFSKVLPHYKAALFEENHWLIIVRRYGGSKAYYSNANWPDCFYNQLFGEYGVLGALLFLICYIGYFMKNIKHWSYSLWISLLVVPFAFISYMFEPLCVMLFYELLMGADLVEKKGIKYGTGGY